MDDRKSLSEAIELRDEHKKTERVCMLNPEAHMIFSSIKNIFPKIDKELTSETSIISRTVLFEYIFHIETCLIDLKYHLTRKTDKVLINDLTLLSNKIEENSLFNLLMSRLYLTPMASEHESLDNNVYSSFINCRKILNDILVAPKEKKSLLPQQHKPIPKVLNTPEVKKIFNKAIEAGVMEKAKGRDGYEWKKSKALLAYLIGFLCIKDKCLDVYPDKEACSLFSVTGLKQAHYALSSNKHASGKPKNFELIDKLFK